MAIVKCKMHKTTQARDNFKFRCVLQPAACQEGAPRRKWSSQFAMLNTRRPAGDRAKRSKLAKEMVSWVQLPPATGEGSPWTMSVNGKTMSVNGKERLIHCTKPGGRGCM